MRPSANGVSLLIPPLSSAASLQLTSVISRSGFEREAFGETESANQIPANTKVLVPLGENHLRTTTGEVNIGRYRGQVLGGSPFILPTFEPSYLLPRRGEDSGTKFSGVVIADIRKAVKVAREGFQRLPVRYLLDPSPAKAEQWVLEFQDAFNANPSNTYLAHDLETEYKSKQSDESELETRDNLILRVGFAYKNCEALTIPWTPEYLPLIKHLYSHPVGKIGWNSFGFDLPILEGNGIDSGGIQYDAIDAWHVAQSHLPRKLEFVASFYSDILPWKHTNRSDFALYNAKDVDATIRIWHGLMAEMQAVRFDGVANAA